MNRDHEITLHTALPVSELSIELRCCDDHFLSFAFDLHLFPLSLSTGYKLNSSIYGTRTNIQYPHSGMAGLNGSDSRVVCIVITRNAKERC